MEAPQSQVLKLGGLGLTFLVVGLTLSSRSVPQSQDRAMFGCDPSLVDDWDADGVQDFAVGAPFAYTRRGSARGPVHRASTAVREQHQRQRHDREDTQYDDGDEDAGVASPVPAREAIGAQEVPLTVSRREHARAHEARCEVRLMNTQLDQRTRPLGLVSTSLLELAHDASSARHNSGKNGYVWRMIRHSHHHQRR